MQLRYSTYIPYSGFYLRGPNLCEAEQFAESDKQKKDLIEVVNSAESAIFDTQQNMDEYRMLRRKSVS